MSANYNELLAKGDSLTTRTLRSSTKSLRRSESQNDSLQKRYEDALADKGQVLVTTQALPAAHTNALRPNSRGSTPICWNLTPPAAS